MHTIINPYQHVLVTFTSSGHTGIYTPRQEQLSRYGVEKVFDALLAPSQQALKDKLFARRFEKNDSLIEWIRAIVRGSKGGVCLELLDLPLANREDSFFLLTIPNEW